MQYLYHDPREISLKIGQVIFVHSANLKKNNYNKYFFCIKMVKMTQNDVILTLKSTKMTAKSTFRKKILHFWIPRKISLKIGWVIFIHGPKKKISWKNVHFLAVSPYFLNKLPV